MKDLLNYIVTSIVTKPEEVAIDEENDNGNVNIYLTVNPDDMGIVIGKGGQTIRSIGNVLTVRAIAENVTVNLQLNDPQAQSEQTPQEGQQQEDN